ncbi:Small nucleolar ribonucleoprotein complex subunit [Penicillium ucsense]|uniref:Small nucleolar ribonucleoprotein complex subunit n=1 Tax=Penicillium ucsense TaxID=2839758 RepID=A0A8J8WJS4_9EURO|nr:Small nucleolar ribonucleoprotein complex subunit [Penicillium ucsense]KAF7738124.1 Small nucleolar ribonucleoprotein complex subunit [Penicillium ucsense]
MSSTGLKTKTKRVSARSPFENTAAATHSADEDIDMDDDTSSDEESVPEKDEDELKLEKMLFGDDEGFMGALKAQQQRENGMRLAVLSDESADEEAEDEEVDLTNMADEDLFFLDSGNVQTSTDLDEMAETPSDEEADEEEDDDVVPAVWHDSDDERIAVSLASQSKLRKLRNFESEDIISGTEYTRRLRRQFQRMNPLPEWADPELAAKRRRVDSDDSDMDRDEEMDSDEDEPLAAQPLAKLLQNTSDLTRIEDNKPGSKRRLRQEVVNIQRLKDVGKAQPSSIDSLTFHPHYPLLLSSGPASTLFLHHISPSAPSPNPLLTSLHIKRTPLHTSAFAPPGGNRIFASGRRRYFHIWDLDTGKVDKVNGSADRKEEQKSMERFKVSPCGRYVGLVGTSRKGGGLINVLDSGTAQWIAQVRVDGRGGVADFAWWSDGEGMTVASKNGEVSEWDGRQRRIIARWLDAGAVGNTVIALGGRSGRTELGGDRWVAIGSTSGIVNIYDRRDWAAAASSAQNDDSTQAGVPRSPTPIRVFDQLTTPVSHLVFAPDGQMMVMASRWKKDALRLVHLPSCTVYRNWPTSSTPLGRISSVAISPNNEQLAVANEQGRIRLFEIRG